MKKKGWIYVLSPKYVNNTVLCGFSEDDMGVWLVWGDYPSKGAYYFYSRKSAKCFRKKYFKKHPKTYYKMEIKKIKKA